MTEAKATVPMKLYLLLNSLALGFILAFFGTKVADSK
jgi:hypothetical protein